MLFLGKNPGVSALRMVRSAAKARVGEGGVARGSGGVVVVNFAEVDIGVRLRGMATGVLTHFKRP